MLKSLYIEGNTPLHRLGVKTKLVILLLTTIGLYIFAQPVVLAAAALITLTIYATLGMPWREAEIRLRPILITITILALVNAYVLGIEEATISTLRLLAILFLAASITATTTIAAFMEAVSELLRPFERLGLVRADDVSLAFGLVLRFVPEIFNHYNALKEAHQARGLPVKTARIIGPLIIMALKDADTIADAIDARGLRAH
ncbi:energy-coupling factor transporter transmembrane protein EcfT [Rhizobium sp. L1K21]|uniref:energy-coupling factor transporter transmembrane component T family protein n=1 Tax=Rhizobium sp. L1K21 TaxID=2954933 RepID=UPI0020931500|nr:energy-coupling factor transporter transmembrane protein EcfT [Rhizobium sp. L1K21]MCO6186869.1 energy-coupling factor transporter transmembrane protein EcfT [Rhizobium sp. L1K21]